ncbi:MAG: LL-diaminopimelate aminotransferase [Thermodesulfovibrionia bacterium]|nr:LL-diaminopimelate aminotransferase [Thermodesulfovibrionia bacterium]MCK5512023.1 LL-diaminopimelate aminotransferase [Thermodesulfovibrionia bacterium]
MFPELAQRVKGLPPYLFEAIDRMKHEALNSGVDLIDFSVGDPDIPTPKHIIRKMKSSVENPVHHRYPSYEGMLSFRQAVAGWYQKRFRVSLNPEKEVLSLIGSKEGIGHIPLAFINPGDIVLVSSPGYPVYPVATLFAGGKSCMMPLVQKNNFLPDLHAIPKDSLKKAKLMFINYPNNPTAAVAHREFYEEVVTFAARYNIIVCHDAAYSEIYYDNQKPMSFLQVAGAKDVGIEFHSLSKTYNMTGWRIGFAVGNAHVLAGLGKIKTNLDSGIFQAVQEAGIEALETKEPVLMKIRSEYQKRRDILYRGLKDLGLGVEKPKATFYLWTKVPKGFDSTSFTGHLLNKAGVLVTPGNGFGSPGEGYVRFSFTVPMKRIREAVFRMRTVI